MYINAVPQPTPNARRAFLAWLKRAQPLVYARVKQQAPELLLAGLGRGAAGHGRPVRHLFGIGALGQESGGPIDYSYTLPTTPSVTSTLSDWANAITKIASPVLNLVQQRQIFKTNLARAQVGQPPISVPSPGVVAAGAAAGAGAMSRVPTYVWILGGVAALGGAALLLRR